MHPFSLRRLLWAGPLSALLAVAANLLFYAASRAAGQAYLVTLGGPAQPAGPLPVLSIVLVTLAASAGASLLLAFLIQVSRAPLPPFLSISAMAMLVSFGGPFSLSEGTQTVTKLLLSCMHLIAGLVIVGGLLLFSRRG